MILIDVNLLVYAMNPRAPEFPLAKPWLEDQMNGVARVGLPWVTLLAYVRLSSNPSVSLRPKSVRDAWREVEEHWLSRTNVWIPEPGPSHLSVVGQVLSLPGITWRKVTDAHLAALAIEHGLTLCSTDGDFANIPGLRWVNPLRQSTLHERPPVWLSAPTSYTRAKTGRPSSPKPRR